jgi:hypothetical protein
MMSLIPKKYKEIKKKRIYCSDRFSLIVVNGLGIDFPAVDLIGIFVSILKLFAFQLFSDIWS